MVDEVKSSPYRRGCDVEAGGSDRSGEFSDDEEAESPFDIVRTKNAPVDRLRRWRSAALVLNASRRFRYTMDLDTEEEKREILRKIRAHAQVIRAAYDFKLAGEKGTSGSTYSGDHGVEQEELAALSRDQDLSALQRCGGVTGLAEKLKTNLDLGIPGNYEDLMQRKEDFGSNTYPVKKGHSFWRFLWEACQDCTLATLIVASVVSLALGIKSEGVEEGWYDGGSIIFTVILVIIVTAISDYVQYLQFQKLQEEKRNKYHEVVRGGRRLEVSIYDIVVGDVVPLKSGDKVPADGVLVSDHTLEVDESVMTGEIKTVVKDSKSPFLMSGCIIAKGCGTMLVTGVGVNTEWGLLMATVSDDNGEETPLQVRLNGLTTCIGKVGLQVAFVVLVVLLARFFTGHMDAVGTLQFKPGRTSPIHAINEVLKIVTVVVVIVFVAVPDGLPLAVTLILSCLMKKLVRNKAVMQRLSACEILGSATAICSNKCGIFTLNQMTVVEAYVYGKKLDSPNDNSPLSPLLSDLLIEGIAHNTTGSISASEGGGDVVISGTPTEKAILSWGVQLGMDFHAKRSDTKIISAIPFNSEKKKGGVAVEAPGSEVHIHWKGAADVVLASCTSHMDERDKVVPLDELKLAFYHNAIDQLAGEGLRCVAIAYRPFELEKVFSDENQLAQRILPENELILLAILGIKDPCRLEIRASVELCKAAGIKVLMVTGDKLQTAKAVALECGILASEADASEPGLIDGKSFREKSKAEMEEVAENILVMGNSLPNDKLLLIQALKKKGHIVAVTGDATTDALALQKADVGIAMGKAGTEVAKDSSDIIMLDDSFDAIVKNIRWGGSVYANIQKFIQFQLTVHVVALLVDIVAAFFAGDIPLNAVQLLWVYLIMYFLGAPALATEPPTDNLICRLPVGQRGPLITNQMSRNLLIQVVYQVSVLLILYFKGRNILHLQHHSTENANKVKNTVIFNAFVLCQIFNEFNARKPDQLNIFEGIIRNRLLLGIIGVTLILQIIIIEFLGKFTSTVRLNWQLWLVCVLIGLLSWPVDALGKLIPVPETRRTVRSTIWFLFPFCVPSCAPNFHQSVH